MSLVLRGAACLISLPFLFYSNVSKALPALSPVQSDLKDKLISEIALFSKEKQK